MKRSKNTTIKPQKPRRTHPHEREAERFWTPYDVVENPDWLVGAD